MKLYGDCKKCGIETEHHESGYTKTAKCNKCFTVNGEELMEGVFITIK